MVREESGKPHLDLVGFVFNSVWNKESGCEQGFVASVTLRNNHCSLIILYFAWWDLCPTTLHLCSIFSSLMSSFKTASARLIGKYIVLTNQLPLTYKL